MNSIETNRDLYLAIAELVESNRSTVRPLEEYLLALWSIAKRYRESTSLSPTEFFAMLSEAFTLSAPLFERDWRLRCDENADETRDFDAWEACVCRQIVDLHEMGEQGILDQDIRYSGVDSPRGHRWYNFDPCTFLECATEGYFGGWQEGDETGRAYVPGKVAILDSDGVLITGDPRDVPAPIYAIGEVCWDDFRSFLMCGQYYE